MNLYRRLIRRKLRPWSADELRRPAIVFSPHFDDETLGCGGTILQKRQAGAAVDLVFMTDGSNSHRHLMPQEDLRRMRSAEGLEAGQALGLSPENVHLLAFEEGRLAEHEDAAVEKVVELLRTHSPQEVFVPYRHEPLLWSDDHRATTRVVKKALARWGAQVIVHEYPIWFYRQWPWTTWAGSGWERKTFLRLGLISPLGLGVLCGLRHRRNVSDVLERKRAALGKHRSQVEPLVAGTAWKTLRDVANGSFLECFLREYELFHSYQLGLSKQ